MLPSLLIKIGMFFFLNTYHKFIYVLDLSVVLVI